MSSPPLPYYDLLRALHYADIPAALALLHGHPATRHYADARKLLYGYSQTLGVTAVDVARLTELLRDLLSGYPAQRWIIPHALFHRSPEHLVTLPAIDALDTPAWVLGASWLPVSDVFTWTPNKVAQICSGRPQVALLVLDTPIGAEAPALDPRWLASIYAGLPDGEAVRMTPGAPAGLPWPDGIEAGQLMQSLLSSAVEPRRWFLADAGYFSATEAVRAFMSRYVPA